MSDAPERIWPHYPLGDGKTEYIRADVAEAEKQLAVAAALREAADVAGRFYAKGQVTMPRDITALIPDGGSALDRALAEQRERCAISETPTPSQVDDACLSYDHSFGLMDAKQADALRHQAKEWWRCVARAAIRAQKP